jgi:hypothetical protein
VLIGASLSPLSAPLHFRAAADILDLAQPSSRLVSARLLPVPITHSVKRKRREKGKPKKEMSCYQSDCSALYSDGIDVDATIRGVSTLSRKEKNRSYTLFCWKGDRGQETVLIRPIKLRLIRGSE